MRKVLVVDDEPSICEVITESLEEQLGVDVECAMTVVGGRRILLAGNVSLAIIDAVLPDGSGIELAILAANENVPAVMTTGHPETQERLSEFGFPFLAKPFGLEELRVRAIEVMQEASENISQVKASAAMMMASQTSPQARH